MEEKVKVIILMLVVLAVLGVATQLFLAPSSDGVEGSKNITDMVNRTVKVPMEVKNVIATSPPLTTVVYMIAPDKLKAVNFQWTDEELKYVPFQYANLPVVGGWYGTQDGNYEEFIAAEPDVVLESTDEGGNNDLSIVDERQSKFGDIPVVGVQDTVNIKSLNNSISFMGDLIGAKDKANQLNDFNNKYLKMVEEKSAKLSDGDKKTVFYAAGSDGLKTYPSGAAHGQLIDCVGGKNVADALNQGNTTGGVQVSIEQVIKWDPDVIITNNMDFYNSVYKNPNWAHLKAVKNKDVYVSPQSPFKWFDNPIGANMIIGLPWTAKVIYPEDYKEINMVDTTKEFYSNFYHYDLSDDQAKEILTGSGLKESNL